MKILVACEESQAVTIELRKLGHEAYSCDVIECSGGHPEWHIRDDVLKHLDDGWDMIIAHPPCTYLSNAGAKHLYKGKVLNTERYKKGIEAKEFFMKLYNANIPKIAIENPLPSKIYNLPPHTQVIQPYQFGHPYKKRTQLWLRGLPELRPTNIVHICESTKVAGNWFNKGGKDRQKNRSKTFSGIARAMAIQWTTMKTEQEIMKDFDGDKYLDAYCSRMRCHECNGYDYNGEPNGYGCSGQEERINIMYESILRRRLKKAMAEQWGYIDEK